MGFGAPLLLAALAATGTYQVGLRSEVRGASGSQGGATVQEGVPYQIDPSLGAQVEATPQLALAVDYTPRLLLLVGAGGPLSVGSSAWNHSVSASANWRADERLRLSLSGALARGLAETSPLVQLTSATAPPQPGQPPPSAVDPSAGVRVGHLASASARFGVEWRARRDLRLSGALGYTKFGGIGQSDRLLFPDRHGPVGEAALTYTVTPRDDLALLTSTSRVQTGGLGSVTTLVVSSRWSHRLAADATAFAMAGVADTLQDSTGIVSSAPFGRVAPQAEVGASVAVPLGRPGVGGGLRLGYAPFLSQYANQVVQRVTALGDLSWVISGRLRLSGAVTAATGVAAGHLGPSSGAAELSVWSRGPEFEFGAGLRAGAERSRPLAGGTIRQWGLVLTVRWTRRESAQGGTPTPAAGLGDVGVDSPGVQR